MGSPKPEDTSNQDLDDSGCVQDGSVIENGYKGQAQLLDLSDDVLLYILQNCTPRDLKALGHTCPRLGALVCDRTLWTHVDARSSPIGQKRLRWLLTHCLSPATLELQLSGYLSKPSKCLGVQDLHWPVDNEGGSPRTWPDIRHDVEHILLRMWYPHLPRFAVSPRWPDKKELETDQSVFPKVPPDFYRSVPSTSNTDPSPPAETNGEPPKKRKKQGSSSFGKDFGSFTTDCKGPQFSLSIPLLRDLRNICTKLTSLTLENCNIDYKTNNICQFPPTLKRLSLQGTLCYNIPMNASFLGKIQERLPGLEYLNVCQCDWFEPASLMPVSKLAYLRELYMRDCRRLAECVAYASLATRYGFRQLKIIDVRGCPLADSEISALGWLPVLEELYCSPPLEFLSSSEHTHSWKDIKLIIDEQLEQWEEEEPEYYKTKTPDPTEEVEEEEAPKPEPEPNPNRPRDRIDDVLLGHPWMLQERRIIVIQPNAARHARPEAVNAANPEAAVLGPAGEQPAPQEPAPMAQEPAPMAQEPAPVAQEAAPIAQEPAPMAQEPVPEPMSQKPVPMVQEPVPVPMPQEPVPVAQESVPIPKEPAPKPQGPEPKSQVTETLSQKSQSKPQGPMSQGSKQTPQRPEPMVKGPQPKSQRPEPKGHGPDPMPEGAEPILHRAEPMIQESQPMPQGAESKFKGPDPIPQGAEPKSKGPDPIPQRAEPKSKGPDPIPQRAEPKSKGPEPISQGAEPKSKGPEPIPQGAEPKSKGPEPISQGAEPKSKGPEPIPQGAEPKSKGPEPIPQGAERKSKGPEAMPHGPEPKPQGPQPKPQGPEPVPQGSDPMPKGPEPMSQEPQPKPQGPDPMPQGAEPKSKGPEPMPPEPMSKGPEPMPQGPDPNPQGPDPNPQGPDPNPQGPDPNPQGPDPNPQGPDPNPQGPNPRLPRPLPRAVQRALMYRGLVALPHIAASIRQGAVRLHNRAAALRQRPPPANQEPPPPEGQEPGPSKKEPKPNEGPSDDQPITSAPTAEESALLDETLELIHRALTPLHRAFGPVYQGIDQEDEEGDAVEELVDQILADRVPALRHERLDWNEMNQGPLVDEEMDQESDSESEDNDPPMDQVDPEPEGNGPAVDQADPALEDNGPVPMDQDLSEPTAPTDQLSPETGPSKRPNTDTDAPNPVKRPRLDLDDQDDDPDGDKAIPNNIPEAQDLELRNQERVVPLSGAFVSQLWNEPRAAEAYPDFFHKPAAQRSQPQGDQGNPSSSGSTAQGTQRNSGGVQENPGPSIPAAEMGDQGDQGIPENDIPSAEVPGGVEGKPCPKPVPQGDQIMNQLRGQAIPVPNNVPAAQAGEQGNPGPNMPAAQDAPGVQVFAGPYNIPVQDPQMRNQGRRIQVVLNQDGDLLEMGNDLGIPVEIHRDFLNVNRNRFFRDFMQERPGNQPNAAEQCPRLRNQEQGDENRPRNPERHLDFHRQSTIHIGHTGYHLVSDSAILRFGRADNDNVNYVNIGPNGVRAGEPGTRPERSNLRILSVTGYRNITDRSLVHLATAAPYIVSIDFSETNVTARGVEIFKAIRPDCDVTFSEYGKNS